MSISNFSITQNPKILFLNQLNENIDKFMQSNLSKLNPNDSLLKEKQIELMYDVEKKRIEEIVQFCKTNRNEVKDDSFKSTVTKKFSNFSTTVLNEKKKFLKSLKQKSLSKMKKQSVFVNSSKDDKLNIISRKRNSSQLSGLNLLTEERFEEDKKVFNTEILKSLYKNKFNLENLREEKEEEVTSNSELTYELSEKNSELNISINSLELSPHLKNYGLNELSNSNGKEVIIFTLVKLKNKILDCDSDKKNLNLLSFFKFNQNERILNYNEDDFNYCFYFDFQGFIKNKIIHNMERDFLQQFENEMVLENEQKDQISILIQDENEQLQSKATIDKIKKQELKVSYFSFQIDNHPKKYSTNLNKKYLEIKEFCEENKEPLKQKNILKCSFIRGDNNYFEASIRGGFYGAFMNLDKNRFEDRLLLEEGILFMVNTKKGFYISSICTEDEYEKKTNILRKSSKNLEFCPINFNHNNYKQFYIFLIQLYENSEEKDFDDLKFKKYFNLFCLEYFKKNKVAFLCFDLIEFFKDYKLFRTNQKCILFKISFNEDFFKYISQNYTFSFGSHYYNELKNFNLQHLNFIFSFNAPYDLEIGFLSQYGKFYLEYKKKDSLHESLYCNFFAREQTNCIKFNSSLEIEEGIWICLTKFNIFQNEFRNQQSVFLPFDSFMMTYRNVFKVRKQFLTTN